MEMDSSAVASWYAGQKVLVTGATGFMGKVLVEKLLRSCPDLAAIYILVRPKKGKDAKQRKAEFTDCAAFVNLKNSPNSEDVFEKLVCIGGDVCQAECGLSEADRELLNSTVTTVFHVAANVRFDQPLKHSIVTNTYGTLNVLEVACHFRKLKVFLHVSTAYCHCHVPKLEEKLYQSPQDPRRILQIAEWMDDEMLKALTPVFLKNSSPNTYSYTKSLSEQLVSEYADRLPLVIARPSIVVASYKEPIPGWVDNINGPTGVMVAAGKGVIRTMHCDETVQADLVPVDMVVNSVLLVAWRVGNEPKKADVEVYNITANRDQPISWGKALEFGRKHMFENPFSVCLWYPGGTPKTNYYAHVIAAFFLHIIPAYIVDGLMTLSGNKPFLVRLQKRIECGLETLQYYTVREWYFHNDKIAKLYDALGAKDKEIFFTNREEINYDEYMRRYILGARKFCVNESEDTLPYARKVLNRLYYLDVVMKLLLIALLLWAVHSFITFFFV